MLCTIPSCYRLLYEPVKLIHRIGVFQRFCATFQSRLLEVSL